MSKIDNIFVKIVTDEDICKEFAIDRPGQYQTITDGIKSVNPYVAALATMLKSVNTSVETQLSDMRLKNEHGPVVLKDIDMREIYRKVIPILENTK